MKPKPGELVVLIEIPPGMLDDLPHEDHQAIKGVVGKPILLNEYDDAQLFLSAITCCPA